MTRQYRREGTKDVIAEIETLLPKNASPGIDEAKHRIFPKVTSQLEERASTASKTESIVSTRRLGSDCRFVFAFNLTSTSRNYLLLFGRPRLQTLPVRRGVSEPDVDQLLLWNTA